MAKKTEIEILIGELVAKGGPITGQIKSNQNPDKVARLLELGWEPDLKKCSTEERLKKIELTLADHEKSIAECSIRR